MIKVNIELTAAEVIALHREYCSGITHSDKSARSSLYNKIKQAYEAITTYEPKVVEHVSNATNTPTNRRATW
jgi:hypothetical protein